MVEELLKDPNTKLTDDFFAQVLIFLINQS